MVKNSSILKSHSLKGCGTSTIGWLFVRENFEPCDWSTRISLVLSLELSLVTINKLSEPLLRPGSRQVFQFTVLHCTALSLGNEETGENDKTVKMITLVTLRFRIVPVSL